jgi:dihydroflavonol-4-reductase
MLLVTGATGLLGNNLVRELLGRSEAVRVLVRGAGPRPELAGLDVEVVRGDLDDQAVLERAVAGCRAVIHSAAMIHIGYTRLEEARRANVVGTRHLAAACRAAGSRMVHVSTVDTLPAAVAPDRPIDELASGLAKTLCTYVISKRESEQVVVSACEQGLDAVIVHPGFMLGPYDWKPSSGSLLLAVKKAPVVVAPRGTTSVCDARDVARAVANAVTAGRTGERYILAGTNIGYPELCERIVAVMQQSKRVVRMRKVIPALARMVDVWNRVTGARERSFNGAAVAMAHLHHAYDSSKAERELDYRRRPLDETLTDAWAWLAGQASGARLQTSGFEGQRPVSP